jgi:hypothetical protein
MSVIIGLATLRFIFLSANIFCKTVGHLVENLLHMKNMAAKKQFFFLVDLAKACWELSAKDEI